MSHARRSTRTTARPCNQAGCPDVATRLGRCPAHAAATDAHQRRTVPTKIAEPRERDMRRAVVLAHVARHGWWCPGWSVPAHASRDLTCDHTLPLAAEGRRQAPGPGTPTHTVLCRPCNSRKNAN